MSTFRRITSLLRSDVGALVPGSDTPFGREVFLRLLLYIGLAVFVIGLFLFSSTGRSRDLSPSRGLQIPGMGDPMPGPGDRRERKPKQRDEGKGSRTI